MFISRDTARALSASVVLSALVLAVVGVTPALAGPTVTVRIEGETSTLLPLTSVTLEQPEPVSGCPADSASAAINLAVDGNWDHGESNGSTGDFTETILGVTESFSHESATWAVWINDKWAGGICEDLLGQGDEVLLIANHEPPPSYGPSVLPLLLTQVPSNVVVGMSFSVRTEKVHTRPEPAIGEGTPEPEAGVIVSGGNSSAESNSNGMATLKFTQPGTYVLIARKSGDAPSAPVAVCVKATSTESGCGPSGSSSSPIGSGSNPATGGASNLFSTPYKGPYAIVAKATSLLERHVYSRKDAPRVLAGSVQAHTTIASVSLRLRRESKGRCFAYDGTREEFGRARCGAGSYFKVSTEPSFSYLLPSALAPGRYVLDIEATDTAGNRTSLARGTSRTVFYVR
jgi:hypothetical protein